MEKEALVDFNVKAVIVTLWAPKDADGSGNFFFAWNKYFIITLMTGM